jgi:hypothetical protein
MPTRLDSVARGTCKEVHAIFCESACSILPKVLLAEISLPVLLDALLCWHALSIYRLGDKAVVTWLENFDHKVGLATLRR